MCTETVWALARRGVTTAHFSPETSGTPLYVRYNSGVAIADNGIAFADLLESLINEWPVPVDEILLLGSAWGASSLAARATLLAGSGTTGCRVCGAPSTSVRRTSGSAGARRAHADEGAPRGGGSVRATRRRDRRSTEPRDEGPRRREPPARRPCAGPPGSRAARRAPSGAAVAEHPALPDRGLTRGSPSARRALRRRARSPGERHERLARERGNAGVAAGARQSAPQTWDT